MNQINEWFSISSVSEKVNIPRETVRRYVRQYGNHLEIKRGERNAYLVHENSLETVKKIRHLMEQGHEREQVKEFLKGGTNNEEQAANKSEIYGTLIKEIQTLAEQNKQLIKSLKLMDERMNRFEMLLIQLQASMREQDHEQDKEQRDYERKRDEHLMKAMSELQEKREGNTNKKKLFTKLFK
ncbi:MerR family transcriptional regulator [Ralstonia pickettii]|nr:MerR family transcriptional regulator [Ralstonia pickettii]